MAYIGNSPENIQRGRRAIYEFTSTAGQTVYTGLDDNNQTLDLLEANEQSVFLNGIRLVPTDDYTVSGDTLTLTSAASLNDHMIIETQTEVGNAVTYTRAESDARYINYDGDIVAGDLQISGEVDAGSLIVDTDTLYVDATNDRVGIGTPSPSATLDVNSTVNGTQAHFGTSSNRELIISSASSGGYDDALTKFHKNSSVGEFAFSNAGGERVRIDGSGNVGIGTDDPQQLLHIHNSSGNFSAEAVLTGRLSTGTPKAEVAFKRGTSGDGAMLVLRSSNSSGSLIDAVTIKDGTGNVGIGTSVPARGLTIDRSNEFAALEIIKNNTTNQIVYLGTGSSGGTDDAILQLKHSGAENIRLYSNGNSWIKGGNVGIGTSSPNSPLEVSNGSENHRVAFGTGEVYLMARNASSYITQEYIANQHVFTGYGDNSSNEAMRLDASGNLLVGNTTTGLSSAGVNLHANGTFELRRNLGSANVSTVGYISRGSTDGNILQFYKNTTHIGSIGTNGDRMNIGTGDAALRFDDTNNAILPWNMTTDSGQNGTISLGAVTNYQFKDLYLSGGVVFDAVAGNATSNTLDDYEEGTWTPTIGIGTTATNSFTGGSYSTQNGRYTKVGNMVTLWFHIRISNKGSQSGSVFMKGLPFTNNSDDSSSEGSTVNINYWNSMGNPVYLTGYVQSGRAQIILIDGDATTVTPVITNTDLTNSSSWYGTVTYRVT
jgi:hypothetical protein